MQEQAGELCTLSVAFWDDDAYGDPVPIPGIMNADLSGFERGTNPKTALGEDVKTKRRSSQIDPGTISLSSKYDHTDTTYAALYSLHMTNDNRNGEAQFGVTYPGIGTTTFIGFITKWKPDGISSEDSMLMLSWEIQNNSKPNFVPITPDNED